MNSKRMITPSEQVDHVWHTHLSQIKVYAEDMKTLFPITGKFDHGPTMGGESENQKFEGTYKYTLHKYNSFFGQPPPEIWEDLQLRFNPKWTAYFNIDLSRFINYMGTVEDLSADFGPD
jgi:hypothetical protein